LDLTTLSFTSILPAFAAFCILFVIGYVAWNHNKSRNQFYNCDIDSVKFLNSYRSASKEKREELRVWIESNFSKCIERIDDSSNILIYSFKNPKKSIRLNNE